MAQLKLEIRKYHFAFLYEITIWLGANRADEITSSTDLVIIPLNINKIEGITESANALKTLFFLKHIIQITQYSTTNIISIIRYIANASSEHHPKKVPGILIIIKTKQPNLPACSMTSIHLLCHSPLNPGLAHPVATEND